MSCLSPEHLSSSHSPATARPSKTTRQQQQSFGDERNMRKLTLLAAAAAATFSANAFAAGITGPRVEAIAGWDHVKTNLGALGKPSQDGFVYGLGVGYDFGVGSKVSLGIDAEITDSTADFDVTSGTSRARLSAGRDLYAGARITGAVTDKLNLYAKVGYTNARFTGTTKIGNTTTSASGNADGVRGGLGLQYALGSKAYVGAEYRYSNYESDLSRHQVVGTVGFRF
jgi:outer membrane immunogenic protein